MSANALDSYLEVTSDGDTLYLPPWFVRAIEPDGLEGTYVHLLEEVFPRHVEEDAETVAARLLACQGREPAEA